jgi:hypothetical protein
MFPPPIHNSVKLPGQVRFQSLSSVLHLHRAEDVYFIHVVSVCHLSTALVKNVLITLVAPSYFQCHIWYVIDADQK